MPQWPRYATSKWLRYECPVDLLVICPDDATADWYAHPIPTKLRGYTHWPIILREGQVSGIAGAEQVNADMAMAVLSFMYHGEKDGVADAFAARILSLEPAEARKYYAYAVRMSSEVARNALENLMATKYDEPFSWLGQRFYREGHEEGLVAGERGTILMVLKARGLKVSERERDLIDACDDLAKLRGWAEAALIAETTEQVFR